MKKWVLLLLLLSPTLAKNYYYESINTNATLLENGDLLVTEEQTLVFDGSFSYVYRDFYEPVNDFQITGDYEKLEKDGSAYVWRGSWTNTKETFTLTYRVKNAVEFTREKDMLYETLIFYDRTVPVTSSTNHITLPTENFTYRVNTGTATKQGNTLKVTANNIQSYEALDVEFTLPKGSLTPRNNWMNFYTMNPELALTLLGLPYIYFAYLIVIGWQQYIDKKRKKKVITNRVNPEKYAPAIAGALVNYRAGGKEITATIIDLAVKGYIHIHKIEKKLWFDETRLIQVKQRLNLLSAYEQKIMNTIFNKKKEVRLMDLNKKLNPPYRVETPFKKIIELIDKEVVNLGLNDQDIIEELGKETFHSIKNILLSLVLTIIYAAFTINYYNTILGIIMGLLIVSDFFSLFILSIATRHILKLTPEGEAARETYKELKQYIRKQPLTEGRIFDTYLPYAIALGVQKEWIKKAEALEYKPEWHNSTITSASMIAITSSINTSVVPHSSGGGGGGGGFGGGGGAGGGGGGAG